MMKTRIISALSMACICFMLCACGTNREVSVPEAMESLTVAKTEGMSGETASLTPSATSEDLNLYTYALPNGPIYAVDRLGQYEERYAVDRKGNLTDSDGNVLIAAENVLRYRPIQTMYFSQDRYSLQAERAALYSVRDQEPQKLYSYCDAELYCAPSSATNGVICLGSSAGTLIDILPDRNARLANIDRKLLNSDEIAIEADDLSHPIRLYIRVLSPLAGDAVITARSLDNSAKAECTVTERLLSPVGAPVVSATPTPAPTPAVAPSQSATAFVNASGNPANHVHTYTKSVTPPTTSSTGYTTYTCSICGFSYQDEFTSKLTPEEPAAPAHIHSYTAVTVPPSATDPGYTLYVCDVCGDSYRANYSPAAGD